MKARAAGAEARERKAALELREALGSSLDVRLVLERAHGPLLRLAQADCAALGVSPSGLAADFQWLVAGLPQAFFASYAEIAAHDFVRAAVARRPNVVLRDSEMISRAGLESNVMYRRAREVGAPLEQVMAVMLHVDDMWQSGMSVYRDLRRPFGARERAALQAATPAIANAVRNCRVFGVAATWEAALGALLADRAAAVVLATSAGEEVGRTPGATPLLERWFAPHERPAGRLPAPLAAALARAAPAWTARTADATLAASLLALPEGGSAGPTAARWAVLLRETSTAVSLPAAWRAVLTPREQQVCEAVVRGWDNRLVASQLGCAVDTVKRHLLNAFDKLGVANRAALIARAAEARAL